MDDGSRYQLMCQHPEGYSLRGIRKRDYPPAMYCQQPRWADYKVFNDAMSRVGMLLARGEVAVDTLVMHTQTSAWICYDNAKNEGLWRLQPCPAEYHGRAGSQAHSLPSGDELDGAPWARGGRHAGHRRDALPEGYPAAAHRVPGEHRAPAQGIP